MSNKTKRSVWNGWVELMADMCWEEHGGSWGKKAPDGSWYVIQFDNIAEHIGERELEESGADRYSASVKRVDLREVSTADIERALDSCAPDRDWLQEQDAETTELVIVESLSSYGSYQPMGEHTDPSYPKRAMAAARREVESLMADADALESALERPVNALGSTAREFGRGDFQSAMARGVHAGNPSARLMAKMHGIDQSAIDDARPDDFLPYMMGYMDARGERNPAQDDDIAPEYHQGYERGKRVNNGEAPAPSWIKEA